MTTQIPSHLLPRDGRFGSGPSKVRPAQLAHLANAGSLMGTSHRQRPVRQLVGKIRSQLSELFSAPDGYEVILGNGGASLLWDAIAFNIVQERAQAAVFGEFSSKPVKPLSNVPWVTEVDVRRVEPGGVALCESVDGIDTYLYAHNETSTGALSPVRRFGDDGALTVIDATSTAGGINLRISEAEKEGVAASPLWPGFVELTPTWTRELEQIDLSVEHLDEYAASSPRTLLLVGTDSPGHLRDDSTFLEERLPDATRVDLEDQNHFAHVMDPKGVAAVIRGFLQSGD